MENILESILSLPPMNLVFIALSAIATFGLILGIARLIIHKSPLDQRLNETYVRATSRREFGEILSQAHFKKQVQMEKEDIAKKAAALVIRGVFDKLFNKPFFKNDQAKLMFSQAGLATTNAQLYYLIGKFVTFCLTFVLTFWLLARFPVLNNYLMITYVSATLVGWSAFDWGLNHMIQERAQKIENGLASALDLMLICVGSGLSFQKSMDRVSREIAPYNAEVAKELAITSLELEILLDSRQAMMNLALRVPSPTIRSFSMTMVQSMLQGTQISRSLDTIAAAIRHQKIQSAEVKASRLPSLLVIPLVLFTLPNIFIVLLGPSLVKVIKVLSGV